MDASTDLYTNARTGHLNPNATDIDTPETLALLPVDETEVADTISAGGDILPYLTPDALIAYCQSRLSGINTQCREIMTRQQTSSREQAALGNLLSALSLAGDDINEQTTAKYAPLDAAYAKAIDEVGAESTLGQKLVAEREKLHAGNDAIVHKEELASLTNTLKNFQSTLNSDSEVDMIRLQSLMSQRQTAIQLATNIVQSLNEQANKIVANIGH